MSLNIPGRDWFDKPGTFEVIVKVDGMESNNYQLSVLAGPPRIRKVGPDGLTLSLDRCVLSPGVVQAFVPEAVFRNGGQNNLRVKSEAGESSPFALKLVEPPVKIQRTPGKFQVVPERAPIPPSIQRMRRRRPAGSGKAGPSSDRAISWIRPRIGT